MYAVIVLRSGCDGVPLYAKLARSTYPKAAKLQSHEATKREKRHRTSDLGAASKPTIREVAIASLQSNLSSILLRLGAAVTTESISEAINSRHTLTCLQM
jgi:hypothetical protein